MKRLAGAFVRALLVVLLIAMPSVLLPQTSIDSAQVIALVAIFAAALTFSEYNTTYPGVVEFRDAPPFNRIRFLSMLVTVVCLSLMVKDVIDPTPLSNLMAVVGDLVGRAIDFPYSPVRLVLQTLPEGSSIEAYDLMQATAGMAYLISLITLGVFVVLIRLSRWPSPDRVFNVWVNLPTFDPTAGGDVVDRLSRDARFNVALGFLLPFIVPMVMRSSIDMFDPVSMQNPQTMIWTISAWAMLPTSLFMRGIAIGRIAEMIREQRRAAQEADEAVFAAA